METDNSRKVQDTVYMRDALKFPVQVRSISFRFLKICTVWHYLGGRRRPFCLLVLVDFSNNLL